MVTEGIAKGAEALESSSELAEEEIDFEELVRRVLALFENELRIDRIFDG